MTTQLHGSELLFPIQRHVYCLCGWAARCRRVKKIGPTKGLLFWSCPSSLQNSDRCDYFEWDNPLEADERYGGGRRRR